MDTTQRIARCGTTEPSPVVLVAERRPRLTLLLAEICGYLRIRVERVAPDADLADALRRLRPIAVVCDIGRSGGDQMLAAVAGFDPDLPLLLAADGDPASRRALADIVLAHGVGNVRHSEREPDFGRIMEFLFLAGRTSGRLALLTA